MKRRPLLASSVATTLLASGCLSAVRDREEGSPNESDGSPPPLSDDNPAYGTDFTTGNGWPVAGYDVERSGYNPNTVPPRGQVGAAWLRTPIEGQRTFRTTPPVTDDSYVYVGSVEHREDDENRGLVVAFDGETGERAWRTILEAEDIESIARTSETLLVVSTSYDPQRAGLTALDSSNGSKRWRVNLPSNPRGGPVVVGERAYVASDEGGLTAVSLDGTRHWDRPVTEGEEYVSTPPCASDSTVFVGTDQGRVCAFAASDGELRWRTDVVTENHRPRIQSLPAVVGQTVYVTGTDYRVHAVDAATGTEQWSTRLLRKSYGNAIPSVTVVGETVYVNTIHGGLLALRRSDGSERWRTGKYGGNLPPAAAGGLILGPTSDGSVQAYDSNGEKRWRFEMPSFDAGMAAYVMNPNVALAHDRAYVSLHDGRVYSLGAK
ncbi:PQQ-binding-like beta-propeller repeat protein [Halorussus salinisoli]|uniref:PQQ-binding-like beta-propeller repeat protein n=1 Tax=Halorussus salinisoli TaxID=2558242 RepID=UPI001484DD8A|nr:PQQ-binding-like beta-propeller repeat protein [Halorussus salinisoli]